VGSDALVIHGSIVAGILATIAYWGYRDATSGVAINPAVGVVQLDLAARVCVAWKPRERHFALLMSLTNLGTALCHRRIGLRSDGRAVGVRIGFSDAGRSGAIVRCKLLALDATSKPAHSFVTQGRARSVLGAILSMWVVVARMGTPHSTLKSFGFQSGFGYCGPIASSVSRTMEAIAALRAHLRSAGITCQGAHSVEHL
jgi:hypothetical protein